jgi:ParB-like nuclease family protein
VGFKETMNIDDIIIENRLRKDMGDIVQLAASIKENGLIQPILLTRIAENDLEHYKLVAGHRRLEAMRSLGITELNHAEHYILREELLNDEYRRTAIELEENIRRKSMTWSEEVLGKQKLLEVYQRIYGAPILGQPSRGVQQGLKPSGFGVRKLAELLNENVATTSQDLEMAALVDRLPILKNEPSREAAKRRLELALKIQAGTHSVHEAKPLIYKILVECESEIHQGTLLTQFRAAGLQCQAIIA